ncbi:MAG: riboflavin synthase [Calditrichaeota bacterium]|nr:MAG: riboflavin synthase [Calditrichota bacterium]
MFSGIIEEIGRIERVNKSSRGLRLSISGQEVLKDLAIDDSIAVSGVCLTVVDRDEHTFHVEAVQETLQRTTLGTLKVGDRVNLERALRLSDRLGGHFVQGHVDGVGKVVGFQDQLGGKLLAVQLPENLMKYVIEKGSIAVDGVSLTVVRVAGNTITIALIPHTLDKTTLGTLQVGDRVNIEVDLIGKYIENLLAKSSEQKTINENWLKNLGYHV